MRSVDRDARPLEDVTEDFGGRDLALEVSRELERECRNVVVRSTRVAGEAGREQIRGRIIAARAASDRVVERELDPVLDRESTPATREAVAEING